MPMSLTRSNLLLPLRQPLPKRPRFVMPRRVTTLPQIPPITTVASIVLGLPLALWAYKCMMMVLFQRRIIYMGYAPLGARKQQLQDLPPSAFDHIRCREIDLQGAHRSRLSGLLVHRDDVAESEIQTLIVYFQGNAGSPIHRIPVFQHLCNSMPPHRYPKIGVLAMAPRSYWKSTPSRPTQAGIIQDYSATIQYALHEFPTTRIVLYGHSLGGAAAICTLAELQKTQVDSPPFEGLDRIRGLVLENPFASIPSMVGALYPQKWLPYRYLAPLVFDKWDSLAALRSHVSHSTILGRLSRDMLILLSEHDEIVPSEMGSRIFGLASQSQPTGRAAMVQVQNALHENAWTKKAWIDELSKYLTWLP